MKITSVINYCTNDYRFIKKCIDSVRPFSSHIIVTFAKNFYDGSDEDITLLEKTFLENPGVNFVDIEYCPNKFSPFEWCVYSRIVGHKNVPSDTDYILMLDSDEIVESKLFLEFLNSESFIPGCDYRFECYWYFRDVIYRAVQTENCSVFLYNKDLNINNVKDYHYDRHSIYEKTNRTKYTSVRHKNQIMFHHFSWARTKEHMLKKVKSWGHNSDRNWTELVEKEFSHEFNGTDFVHGYQYETVDPIV